MVATTAALMTAAVNAGDCLKGLSIEQFTDDKCEKKVTEGTMVDRYEITTDDGEA